MISIIEKNQQCVAVYGKAYIINENGNTVGTYPTEAFNRKRLSQTCFVCQPATLIRRKAWEEINGLDQSLHMCLDYDLWWRLSKIGELVYIDEYIACSRDHSETKTNNLQQLNHKEAFKILKKYYGFIRWNWIIGYEIMKVKQGSKRLNFIEKFLVVSKAGLSLIYNNILR